MDANDIPRLQSEKDAIMKWLNHPLTQRLQKDNDEQKEKLTLFICNGDIEEIRTYFTAVGHLRGLRRAFGIIQDDLDEIEEQLKGLA